MWSPAAFSAALVNGHYETAEWMFEIASERASKEAIGDKNPYINCDEAMVHGFSTGDLVLLEWLRERGLLEVWTWYAKKAGHVHVLEYAEQHFPDVRWAHSFGYSDAEGGSIAAAKWAFDRGKLWESDSVVHSAAEHGHIEFLHWYTDNLGDKLSPAQRSQPVTTTAERGHLECVRFLIENGYGRIRADAIHESAVNGHIEIAKYLLARYDPTESSAWVEPEDPETNGIDVAALTRLNLEATMRQAAANGHLNTVKWLHGMLFEFDKYAIRKVAANGHLDVVQYMVKHAPENDIVGALTAAAKGGHLAVVKFLLSHFPQSREEREALVDMARKAGHVNIVRRIKNHGFART